MEGEAAHGATRLLLWAILMAWLQPILARKRLGGAHCLQVVGLFMPGSASCRGVTWVFWCEWYGGVGTGIDVAFIMR